MDEKRIVIAGSQRLIQVHNERRCPTMPSRALRLTLLLCLSALPSAAASRCSAEIRVIETSLDPANSVEVKVIETPGRRSSHQIPAKTTNAQGMVRFDGLNPKKTPQLLFGIAASGPRSGTVFVDLRKQCHGTYQVVLPDKIPSNANR